MQLNPKADWSHPPLFSRIAYLRYLSVPNRSLAIAKFSLCFLLAYICKLSLTLTRIFHPRRRSGSGRTNEDIFTCTDIPELNGLRWENSFSCLDSVNLHPMLADPDGSTRVFEEIQSPRVVCNGTTRKGTCSCQASPNVIFVLGLEDGVDSLSFDLTQWETALQWLPQTTETIPFHGRKLDIQCTW